MPDRAFFLAQLTSPGRGAVATVAVEGNGAWSALEPHFQPISRARSKGRTTGRLLIGRIGGDQGEEVVVRVQSPKSLEIHCHGGEAAIARIQQTLIAEGGRNANWQTWVGAHEPDAIRHAARCALAHARTERTAAILLDQYQGALRRAIEEIQRCLAGGDAATARSSAEALLSRKEIGRHLVQPWRVVLAGPPNVGKSSLINALVGYERAIVHPTAGTTRDVVTATAAIDGWPVELSDTAGLRDADNPLEQAGMQMARRELAAADLVALVFDASQPWSDGNLELLKEWPDGLVVHNKSDLGEYAGPSRPVGIVTSAATGEGVDRLIQAIVGRLVPDPPPPGAAVPFTEDQIEQLQSVVAAIDQGSGVRWLSFFPDL